MSSSESNSPSIARRSRFRRARLRYFREGMHCNRWEREIWRKWRPKFKWENLSAILLSDPLGFVVVMPWAELVTEEDIRREMPHDHYPAFHSEPKAADHGRVNGRVVVRYYGLPSADMVVPDRQRYETHEGPAQRLDLPA